MQDLYEMGKNFYELPGWEVSIRFWRCKCLEDETFFMQTPLKLCHCKRVYASKQGDFSKTPTVFSRHWMQMEDLKYQKGIVRTKRFQLSKKFGGLNPVNSWREEHETPLEGERFDQRKVQLQNLGSYEFMWYSIHLLLNSKFVCCFVLSYQSITPERLICLHNLAHSSANLGLVGRFAVLICSKDVHVLDSWMIFWEKLKDAGCAW